jgi:NAD(P)-dependent dehydrogenase (short-subunit alcohol dehydrogenase family)/acyl carrier protein
VLASRRGDAAHGTTELAAELRHAGVRVDVVACDVAGRQAVAELVRWLDAEGHQVGTVVHAAALMQLNSLSALTVAEFADVVRAKVAGAVHLEELLAHHPVRSFVLFSSIAGVWGSGDHGAYAAANAHLDAFAEWCRAARGCHALSVAWGVWNSDKLPDAVDPALLNRQGLRLIDPELALAGLRGALDHDETFVALADVDWQRFVPVFSSAGPRPLLEDITEAAGALAPAAQAEPAAFPLAQRLAGMSQGDRDETLAALVREHVTAVLRHSDGQAVSAGRSFKQLGLDSLTAVDLRNRLNRATGLKLPATLAFDHPTPAAVARFLERELLPEAPGGSVQDELDRLEAALAGQRAGESGRAVVAARLRVLLAELDGRAADDEDDLGFATDEEMFKLIDRELGES